MDCVLASRSRPRGTRKEYSEGLCKLFNLSDIVALHLGPDSLSRARLLATETTAIWDEPSGMLENDPCGLSPLSTNFSVVSFV